MADQYPTNSPLLTPASGTIAGSGTVTSLVTSTGAASAGAGAGAGTFSFPLESTGAGSASAGAGAGLGDASVIVTGAASAGAGVPAGGASVLLDASGGTTAGAGTSAGTMTVLADLTSAVSASPGAGAGTSTVSVVASGAATGALSAHGHMETTVVVSSAASAAAGTSAGTATIKCDIMVIDGSEQLLRVALDGGIQIVYLYAGDELQLRMIQVELMVSGHSAEYAFTSPDLVAGLERGIIPVSVPVFLLRTQDDLRKYRKTSIFVKGTAGDYLYVKIDPAANPVTSI